MQTPELLLTKLNQALRELRGAARELEDTSLDEKILPIMRRLMLAEIMSSRQPIAVGGIQGAGKTTLVRTMYRLGEKDPWLPANEGRGETLPVLIEEDPDCETPHGFLLILEATDAEGRYFAIQEQRCDDSRSFVDACRGGGANVLLPVLHVPPRFFGGGGPVLLLLPGYEKRSRKNEEWQDLMRQALIGAKGCVIVTDATRLASQAQQDIVKDMLAGELRTARPIIVVAKTEALADNQKRLDELRASAVEAFGLDAEHGASRVVCAGVNAHGATIDYPAIWMPELAGRLHDMSHAGAVSRQEQFAHLEKILATDLTMVVGGLRNQATMHFRQFGTDDGAQETMDACLHAFEESRKELRKQYQREVKAIVDTHLDQAAKELDKRLTDEHEGFVNKIKNIGSKSTEDKKRIEASVLGAWHKPGSLAPAYTAALGNLTRVAGPKQPQEALPLAGAPLQRLGYVDADGKPVTSKFADKDVQDNLRALMQSKAGDVTTGATNRKLEETAALLPVMALEYIRIASAIPELVRVDGNTMQEIPEGDLTLAAQSIGKQFGEFSEATRGILKGVAAVMAVDIAADGQADIINGVLGIGSGGAAAGGAAAAAGMTVGGAVAGVFAIGFLAHTAMKEMRNYDDKVGQVSRRMLRSIHDHHTMHYNERFDDVMDQVQARLKEGMRRRYGMDQRLVKRDRLTKALADVKTLQQDLLSQLAQSGQSLVLFRSSDA